MFLLVLVIQSDVGRIVPPLLNSLLPSMEAARSTRFHGVGDVRYV